MRLLQISKLSYPHNYLLTRGVGTFFFGKYWTGNTLSCYLNQQNFNVK